MIQNSSPSLEKPLSITVDMASRRNGRRFAIVSGVLSAMGLHHTARFGLLRRFRLKGLEAKALQSVFCSLASGNADMADVLITDRMAAKHSGKIIRIDYDFQRHLAGAADGETLFLPILFHPDMLNGEAYAQADKLAGNAQRSIGVLFAGNCDPKTYDNPAIEKEYGLLNRVQLMRQAEQLPGEQVFFPENREALEQARAKGELVNRFVWIDTTRFRIPQDEWLSLVGDASYFFCTPGVHYPYCQNLNEAMACGTVPILQYSDYYRPELQDRVNCIAFRDKQAIGTTLDNLPDGTSGLPWESLSAAAKTYHDQQLSLDRAKAVIGGFLQNPDQKELTWVLAGKR